MTQRQFSEIDADKSSHWGLARYRTVLSGNEHVKLFATFDARCQNCLDRVYESSSRTLRSVR